MLGHFVLLPIYALQTGSDEAQALGLLTTFIVGGIALQFVVGWLADRASARRVLIGSALLFALVAMSLPLLSDPWLTTGAVFLMGGIGVGFYTLSLTHIGQRVRVDQLAVANAAFLISYQIGAMIGPTVGGIAMGAWQPYGFVAAMIAAALIGALAMAAVRRKPVSSPAPLQGR